jgi:acyl-coenzyme A thioesterase PaaI-like protein
MDQPGVRAPEPWTFGVEPLPQALALAPTVREVVGLVLALDHDVPAVDRLLADLRAAAEALAAAVPPDPTPRVGADASSDRRPYLDHSRDVGTYNPMFPDYVIAVDGPRATGTVTFPVAFEGPPGFVHGGVLATFFDCAIQHHNCDVGVAGRTTSLLVEYRRPAPLGVPLAFEIDRDAGDRRITSRARLAQGDETLCTATMEAAVGDRSRLPHVPPRAARP